MNNYKIAVVCAVNDSDCLNKNLEQSEMIKSKRVPIYYSYGAKSAAAAYNRWFHVDADYLIFAHQDCYFPAGWDQKLLQQIKQIEKTNNNWAVLGVIGCDIHGALIGRCWSNALQRDIKGDYELPAITSIIDELCIIVKRSSGIRFDENLGFHLYGADICLTAIRNGFSAWVINAPVVHNGLRIYKVDKYYRRAYRYMQVKYFYLVRDQSFQTLIMPISSSSWPIIKNYLKGLKKQFCVYLTGKKTGTFRAINPTEIAKQLGYEYLMKKRLRKASRHRGTKWLKKIIINHLKRERVEL